jgi:hypothetical protein
MNTTAAPLTWAEIKPGMIVKYPKRWASPAVGTPGSTGYSPAVPAGYIIFRVANSHWSGAGWMATGRGVVGEGFSNTGTPTYCEVWFAREYADFEVLDERDEEAELAFHAAEEARGPLAYTPEQMECYECGGFNGADGPMKRVVALGKVVNRADPTQTYRLECGHVAI